MYSRILMRCPTRALSCIFLPLLCAVARLGAQPSAPATPGIDIAVISLPAPSSTESSYVGVPIFTIVRCRNIGTVPTTNVYATVDVLGASGLRMGGCAMLVTDEWKPGEERDLAFEGCWYVAATCDRYSLRVLLTVPGDVDTSNNVVRGHPFTVIDRGALVPRHSPLTSRPYDTLVFLPGHPTPVIGSVTNVGNDTAMSISASFVIRTAGGDTVYRQYASASPIAPGLTREIPFKDWTPRDTGRYDAYLKVYNNCRPGLSDSTITWSFTARYARVDARCGPNSIAELLPAPGDLFDRGSQLIVSVPVTISSEQNLDSCALSVLITDSEGAVAYRRTVNVSYKGASGDPAESLPIYGDCVAEKSGRYSGLAVMTAPADFNRSNDTLRWTFDVKAVAGVHGPADDVNAASLSVLDQTMDAVRLRCHAPTARDACVRLFNAVGECVRSVDHLDASMPVDIVVDLHGFSRGEYFVLLSGGNVALRVRRILLYR